MATKKTTIEYLLDQLSSIKDIRSRAMFGEYALYADEKVVALVCDDDLFVKVTEPGKKLVGTHYEEGFPYPGAKPAILITGDLTEDRTFLANLIKATAKALPAPKPKKKKK